MRLCFSVLIRSRFQGECSFDYPPSSCAFSNPLTSIEGEGAFALDEACESRESYASLLQLIASLSDVDAKAKVVFRSAKLVHLESEDYKPPPDSLALTTTKSVAAFLLAHSREFAQRDLSGSEPRQVKWGAIHKTRDNKPSYKPYTPGDDVVGSEALADPPLMHAWMPQPPRRLDFSEHDAKHFETVTRRTLNAVSVIEAILQALRRCSTPDELCTLVQALTPATKVVMQLQTAELCQWVQVRRDHWLSRMSQLSPQDLQLLRHAPIVGARNLFPASTVERVAKQSEESIRYNAFLSLAQGGGQKASHKPTGQQRCNEFSPRSSRASRS
jgi:hypothetical protein